MHDDYIPRPMQWLAYAIGISAIVIIAATFIAAVITGEWRWLIITVSLLLCCSKSSYK